MRLCRGKGIVQMAVAALLSLQFPLFLKLNSLSYSRKPSTSKHPKKKSKCVKSHDLGGQFWFAKHEITRSGNDWCTNIIVSRTVWYVASLKPNVLHILIFNSRQEENSYHFTIPNTFEYLRLICLQPKNCITHWQFEDAFGLRELLEDFPNLKCNRFHQVTEDGFNFFRFTYVFGKRLWW